ncbi:MAG: peptide chain release factor 1 [Candidatus Kerfeldbacteria bacterium]|nr:peptide chain release factor 1 [Candidatus Kerfeldbacteria bacterium]
MDEKLDRARARHRQLEQQLQDSAVTADRERFVMLSREYAELDGALRQQAELESVRAALAEAAAARQSTEAELRQLAAEEEHRLLAKAQQLDAAVRAVINPPDPRDRKDTVLEIRAGTGGDEAALFAAELFRLYTRYAERKGWTVKLVNQARTPLGGYKEVIAELSGGPVWRDLKFESGVHRVQRIPATEKAGRVHTSTATVVVLPEADEIEVALDPSELEITATTSRGHGGQSVNTTYSAIRVLHKPTGIAVNCQDERSQMQNREKALRILRARLLAHREAERQRQASAARKSLIGTGERAEKIRTYNFPQDRLTDHRLKTSWHGLARIMDGELEPIIERLRAADSAMAERHES